MARLQASDFQTALGKLREGSTFKVEEQHPETVKFYVTCNGVTVAFNVAEDVLQSSPLAALEWKLQRVLRALEEDMAFTLVDGRKRSLDGARGGVSFGVAHRRIPRCKTCS